MKTKNIIIVILAAISIATIYYSMQGSQDDAAYVASIEKERKEKNVLMRSGDESPFSDSVSVFTGLKYYPVDINYRIIANLVPIENKKIVVLATSDGKEKKYLEYAYAEFDLGGEENKLLIFEMIEMGPYRGTLFLAFGDATSGRETYGAGRYLDIRKAPGATSVTLDFNNAYNPYCAYNDNYSCPLPPRENLLTIPIEAGEKVYY
ncbi:MAG: DUF1684 domain-containing protein [Flammeovirgaceae bacterium]|nr:DUF1684 domain-containing protein [Flammeovirgaceae bacterium]